MNFLLQLFPLIQLLFTLSTIIHFTIIKTSSYLNKFIIKKNTYLDPYDFFQFLLILVTFDFLSVNYSLTDLSKRRFFAE